MRLFKSYHFIHIIFMVVAVGLVGLVSPPDLHSCNEAEPVGTLLSELVPLDRPTTFSFTSAFLLRKQPGCTKLPESNFPNFLLGNLRKF